MSAVKFLLQVHGIATYALLAMLFFNFLVIMHGPTVHSLWPLISSLLVCPRPLQPSFFLNNYLLIIEALSSCFFDFGSMYLKKVGLSLNNAIMSAGESKKLNFPIKGGSRTD